MKTKKSKTKKARKREKKITKNMYFSEVLQNYPQLTPYFLEEGMHCLGCGMAMMETVEQGCLAHGIDPDKFVEKMNSKLKMRRK